MCRWNVCNYGCYIYHLRNGIYYLKSILFNQISNLFDNTKELAEKITNQMRKTFENTWQKYS